MTEFRKELEISEEDYIEFNQAHYRKFRLKPLHLWLIILIASLLFSAAIIITIVTTNAAKRSEFTAPSAIGLIIFVVILFTISFWVIYFVVRPIIRYMKRLLYKRAYKKYVKFKHAEIILNDKGIETRNDKVVFSVVWDQIQKLVETENSIYFYYNKNAAFLLPKRYMGSLDELVACRNFAKGNTQLEIKYIPLDKR